MLNVTSPGEVFANITFNGESIGSTGTLVPGAADLTVGYMVYYLSSFGLNMSSSLPSVLVGASPGFLRATGTIRSATTLECAAAKANGSSLASKARLQGDNVASQIGEVFLGNTFTDLYYFGQTVLHASNAAPVYWGLLMNGFRVGLPGGGPLSKGVVGTIQDTALQAAFSNAGPTAAQTAASYVGNAKVGYDFLTFGSAILQCVY